MKTKTYIEKLMREKSMEYIDWEYVYHRRGDKAGIKQSRAFCEGFEYALCQLILLGIVSIEDIVFI